MRRASTLPSVSRKPKGHKRKSAVDKAFLELGRKHFAHDFPNPTRQGCPQDDVLRLLAEQPKQRACRRPARPSRQSTTPDKCLARRSRRPARADKCLARASRQLARVSRQPARAGKSLTRASRRPARADKCLTRASRYPRDQTMSVVRPHPEDLHGPLGFDHLVDEPVLDVDAPRTGPGEVRDELLEGRWVSGVPDD